MTLHDHLTAARRRLERAGIDAAEAAVDAELLARHVLGWDRAKLFACSRDTPPLHFAREYEALIARRESREPAAYIVGCREFWNRDFEVGPGVLVPRPETELIVEEALARLPSRIASPSGPRPLLVADVGTGSGCLAITLALEFADARVVATDLSPAALAIATRNAARHAVSDRVDFRQTSLLTGLDTRFDLIASNPPYVPAAELETLQPEVREFEPMDALDGGKDGLDLVRHLLLQAEARLQPGGLLVFEFGFGQDAAVRASIAARPAFRLEAIRQDLQGIPRTAIASFVAGL